MSTPSCTRKPYSMQGELSYLRSEFWEFNWSVNIGAGTSVFRFRLRIEKTSLAFSFSENEYYHLIIKSRIFRNQINKLDEIFFVSEIILRFFYKTIAKMASSYMDFQHAYNYWTSEYYDSYNNQYNSSIFKGENQVNNQNHGNTSFMSMDQSSAYIDDELSDGPKSAKSDDSFGYSSYSPKSSIYYNHCYKTEMIPSPISIPSSIDPTKYSSVPDFYTSANELPNQTIITQTPAIESSPSTQSSSISTASNISTSTGSYTTVTAQKSGKKEKISGRTKATPGFIKECRLHTRPYEYALSEGFKKLRKLLPEHVRNEKFSNKETVEFAIFYMSELIDMLKKNP